MRTIIQTPTPNLSESRSFYEQLGYQLVSNNNLNLFTDGTVQIAINPDRFARISIQLYHTDWSTILAQLPNNTPLTTIQQGHILSDPNGIYIHLLKDNLAVSPSLDKQIKVAPGQFAGISIETLDMKRTTSFWKALGYQLTQGAEEQGWMTFGNGSGVDVSIMKAGTCPHLFFNPSLTYFNGGNNIATIEKIRKTNIPITEEITQFNPDGLVDNIIIRDPGGLGFFIFND